MTTTITVDILKDNAHGVTVRYMGMEKPSVCPGLGGWKPHDDRGVFVTTIKHPQCVMVREAVMFAPFEVEAISIAMDGERIVEIKPVF